VPIPAEKILGDERAADFTVCPSNDVNRWANYSFLRSNI
jgi:hypothetical protein